MTRLFRAIGRGFHSLLNTTLALVIVGSGIAAYANYGANLGTDVNFGSAFVSSVHYAKMLLCDLTAPATQCAAVSAAGAVKVDGSAVTQPVSGTVNPTTAASWGIAATGAGSAPSSANYIGWYNGTNFVGVTTSTPLPVAAAGDADNTVNGLTSGGSLVQGVGRTASTAPTASTAGNNTTWAINNTTHAGYVTIEPNNASQTSISASTSATPGNATQLVAASAARRKVQIKVEGAAVVCFSKFTATPVTSGAAGVFCLKGATTANAGDGGSYVTPPEQSDTLAIYMVSATASVGVYAETQ